MQLSQERGGAFNCIVIADYKSPTRTVLVWTSHATGQYGNTLSLANKTGITYNWDMMEIMKKQPEQTPLSEESKFLQDVRNLITAARSTAERNIDRLQVLTNFKIGCRIVEEEQKGVARAEYGKHIIPKLSSHLKAEFGRGFSSSNLEYMRKFYLTYQSRVPGISQTASGKFKSPPKPAPIEGNDTSPFLLSWSQYVFLISLDNEYERNFYEIEAADNNWNLPELRRQFDSGLYERLALSRDKTSIKTLSKEGQVVTGPRDIIKDPYVLEFLGIDEKSHFSETDLERAIINKIEHFLLELGKGFLFEARQKRFTFNEEHFFVDLVFYNRLLRSYVLIDLKIGKLTHQNLGQMQMYVNYFDRYVKRDDENSTIGIILCRKKNEALVEITIPKNTNIHASEYQLYLPSKDELRKKLMDWTKDIE
jgi:predicted nuclease of restriction endonuclease-like (RecB) superfamily